MTTGEHENMTYLPNLKLFNIYIYILIVIRDI